MKIAVLTYNLGLNYGGILQSYALIEKLKRLKHEPELLFIKTSYKPSWKGLIKKAILSIFSRKYKNLYDGRIYRNTFYFVDKYINPKTKPLENEDDFSNLLSTSNFPDPDLLIRTGDEIRISNFFLWQISYSELYFSKLLWPDFKLSNFKSALNKFSTRDRRFGKE